MAHFDEGYQDSFELGNEDIDDDDTGEDQRINSAVNIHLSWYKVAYYKMFNFCGKGRKLFQKLHSNEMTI